MLSAIVSSLVLGGALSALCIGQHRKLANAGQLRGTHRMYDFAVSDPLISANVELFFLTVLVNGLELRFEGRLRNRLLLDEVATESAVWARLDESIRYAQRHGVAVVIGHPNKSTLRVIEQAGPRLAAAGVKAVAIHTLFPPAAP